MKEKIKYYTRKIFQILFFASILFTAICFYCEPLFGVEFIYDRAIFISVLVTLLSAFAVVPLTKFYMWLFYPLILLTVCAFIYYSFLFFLLSGSIHIYKSPGHTNTLIIKETGIFATKYQFYAVKGVLFKKEFNNSEFDVPNQASTGGGGMFMPTPGTFKPPKYVIKSVTWSDEYTVKVLYTSEEIIDGKPDKSRIEDSFKFPRSSSQEYDFDRKSFDK
jgi:hypothetical protein